MQQDHLLERYEFTVSVINQKAYLYGTVDSHYEKMWAADVASRVAGVSEIGNYITVSQVWEWKSDAEIKADVEGELFWSSYAGSEDITVEVEDGDVTLEGVATDWAEADAAVGNAFEGGARSVRARLNLADGFKKETGIDLCADRQALKRLYEACENAKCKLSNTTETELSGRRVGKS